MEADVREKVQSFLGNVQQIPTLPDVYMRVKKAFEDPSLSVEYLAEAIRLDQSITIAILRLANSPFFGFKQKISSINQAIMLIGLREVYSLVLSVSIMGLFPVQDDETEKVFPTKKFWEYSLAVAISSRVLGTIMGYPHPEDLFVAGLIHDIGKLIQKMYMSKEFITICQRSKKEERLFIDIERENLGFTHQEVGELLAENWRFPPFLTTATGMHHTPELIADKKIAEGVSVIHVAESLVRGLKIGWSGDPYVSPVDMEALKKLHLVPFNDLPVIIGRINREFTAAVNSLIN